MGETCVCVFGHTRASRERSVACPAFDTKSSRLQKWHCHRVETLRNTAHWHPSHIAARAAAFPLALAARVSQPGTDLFTCCKFAAEERPVADAAVGGDVASLFQRCGAEGRCKKARPTIRAASARLLGEVRRKRPGRQRRAGEARPAGSRAWIDRPRNTRGGWNHPTPLRASERHTCTCGGSPALLCAAAARGGYSTIHTKAYNPLAEIASPYTHNLTITAHTLRPPTAT